MQLKHPRQSHLILSLNPYRSKRNPVLMLVCILCVLLLGIYYKSALKYTQYKMYNFLTA